MWKSYLTVALRTMRRQAGYTAINVGGLAVGIMCCLLIGVYVRNERAVNGTAVFPEGERIYRLDSDWREPSMGMAITTLAPAAETLKRTYPEVEEATRLYLMTNAGLLLLLASINFTNLATARALTRGREVGVRKAVGAHRGQVARQFLGEAVLVTTLAAGLGTVLAAWAQPFFFEVAGKPQVVTTSWDLGTLGLLGGLIVLVSLLAGWYPALVLARFDPMRALKGTQRLSAGAFGLRQGLLMVQFGVVVVLIVALHTIARQMDFVASRDLGFEQEQVLVINSLPRAFDAAGVKRMQAVKTRLLAIPGVEAASLSWRTAAESSGTRAVQRPGQPDEDVVITDYAVVDASFAKTYGLALEEGRFFNDDRPGDADGIVLNETAARMLGLTEGIAGQLAGLAVSYQTIKAARTDPAHALRHE